MPKPIMPVIADSSPTLIQSSLVDAGNKFLRFQSFPEGWEIRLFNLRTKKYKRPDTGLNRYRVNRHNIRRVADDESVFTLLQVWKDSVSTDLDGRGLEPQLHHSEQGRVYGNTHIGTLRALADKAKNPDPLDGFALVLEEGGLAELSMAESRDLWNILAEVFGKDVLEERMVRFYKKRARQEKVSSEANEDDSLEAHSEQRRKKSVSVALGRVEQARKRTMAEAMGRPLAPKQKKR